MPLKRKVDGSWTSPASTHLKTKIAGEWAGQVSVPGVPTNITVDVGHAANGTPFPTVRSLVFTPPSDGGSPILRYEWKVEGGNWLEHQVPEYTASGQNLQHTQYTAGPYIDGVQYPGNPGLPVRGIDQNVYLRAVNTIGAGESSPAVVVRWPGLPSVPRNVVFVPGDGSVSITFDPPDSDGGYPIVSYVAFATDSELQEQWIEETFPAGEPVILTGMTNNLEYFVALAADNGYFSGATAEGVATPSA